MRSTDNADKTNKRSPRYQLIDNKWYFKTREGDLLGPYNNVEDTVQGVDVYIGLMALNEEINVA